MQLMDKPKRVVWLTPQQVADDLDMAKSTVLEWLRNGKLPGYNFGNWKINETEYEAWKRSRRNTQEPTA